MPEPTKPAPEHDRETWRRFIDFCRRLGHGTLERVEIHDGLPVLAERCREKVKFNA